MSVFDLGDCELPAGKCHRMCSLLWGQKRTVWINIPLVFRIGDIRKQHKTAYFSLALNCSVFRLVGIGGITGTPVMCVFALNTVCMSCLHHMHKMRSGHLCPSASTIEQLDRFWCNMIWTLCSWRPTLIYTFQCHAGNNSACKIK
jgi:hypothetical protein